MEYIHRGIKLRTNWASSLSVSSALRAVAFAAGGGPEAARTDVIFPLLTIYTVQNGAAPFDTWLPTSLVLNLLSLTSSSIKQTACC